MWRHVPGEVAGGCDFQGPTAHERLLHLVGQLLLSFLQQELLSLCAATALVHQPQRHVPSFFPLGQHPH
jgi:hypothetical protein